MQSDVLYKRDLRRALLLRRITLALLGVGLIGFTISGTYYYLFFIAIAYFILDFIFPIYNVTISANHLRITRLYVGGLFKKKTTISKNAIKEVTNIDTGVTTDSMLDFEYSVFAPTDSDSMTKKYERYRIRYLDETGSNKTCKVPFLQSEVRMLIQAALPTT